MPSKKSKRTKPRPKPRPRPSPTATKPKETLILANSEFRNDFKKLIPSKKANQNSTEESKYRYKEVCFQHIILPMLKRHSLLPNQQKTYDKYTQNFYSNIYGCQSTNCGIVKAYIAKYNLEKQFEITMKSLNLKISAKNAAMSDLNIEVFDAHTKHSLIKHKIKLIKLMAGAIKRYVQPKTTKNVVCTASFAETELFFVVHSKKPFVIMSAGIRKDNTKYMHVKTDKSQMPADVAPFWYRNWSVQGLSEEKTSHDMCQLLAIHNNKFVGDINDNLDRIVLTFFMQNASDGSAMDIDSDNSNNKCETQMSDIYVVINGKRLDKYPKLTQKQTDFERRKRSRFEVQSTPKKSGLILPKIVINKVKKPKTENDKILEQKMSGMTSDEQWQCFHAQQAKEIQAMKDLCDSIVPKMRDSTKTDLFIAAIPKNKPENKCISDLAHMMGIPDPINREPILRVKYQSTQEIEDEFINDPLLEDYYDRDTVLTDRRWDSEWELCNDGQLKANLAKLRQQREESRVQFELAKNRLAQITQRNKEMESVNAGQKHNISKMVRNIAGIMAGTEHVSLLCLRGKKKVKRELFEYYIKRGLSLNLNLRSPNGTRRAFELMTEYLQSYKVSLDGLDWDIRGIHSMECVTELNNYLTLNERQNLSLFAEWQLFEEPMIRMRQSVFKQSEIMELYRIDVKHRYIQSLQGQLGVLAKESIKTNTILGELKGIYFVESEFNNLFKDTCDWTMALIDSFLYKLNSEKKLILVTNHKYYQTFQFASFINDPRQNFFEKNNSDLMECDCRYWNVLFQKCTINGWPRIFIIAKRDIERGEELMGYYNGSESKESDSDLWLGKGCTEIDHYLYKLRRLCDDSAPMPDWVRNGIRKQSEIERVKRESMAMDINTYIKREGNGINMTRIGTLGVMGQSGNERGSVSVGRKGLMSDKMELDNDESGNDFMDLSAIPNNPRNARKK